ncbi:MAG: NDP-sugar synthase [Candidatus Margulisbacteria bacterium]|nr:NDP-sugar synthase [Candidatus Margulisiibacteriota bacterium]
MKAVIIAGGLGTRLRPLTYNTPKPIVPVANRPFVVHQIEHLIKHGVDEIILNLQYLSGEIKKILDDGKEWGIKIRYSVEAEPLGTAGAVKNAEEFFDEGPLVIFNGDILTDINISKVISFHREKNATVTLTMTEVEDPTPFGLILTDKDGRVTKFIEKPSSNQVTARTINAGIYVVDPKIFKAVPKGKHFMFERDLYPALLQQGAPIYGYLSTAYWIDIGSPAKYREVHQAILRGEVPVKIYGTRIDGKFWLGKDTHPDQTVRFIGPSLIGEKVKIGKGTEIKDYVVVGDKVSIGENCSLERAIVWRGTKIGNRARLADCILGYNCVLEDEVVIEGGAVLADGSLVKKGTRISA